jgi:hypothetical protein
VRQDSCSRSAGLAARSSRTIDSHRPGASRRGNIAETGQSLPAIARSAPNAFVGVVISTGDERLYGNLLLTIGLR